MIMAKRKKISSFAGRHHKWIPAPKTKPMSAEKKKKLLALLKSAEVNHAKAGANIKKLRTVLKKRGVS